MARTRSFSSYVESARRSAAKVSGRSYSRNQRLRGKRGSSGGRGG